MNVRMCTDPQEWNALVQDNFLQSWEWGEMQQSYGREVRRYVIQYLLEPVAAIQFVVYPLAFGRKYVFSPRGPVVCTDNVGRLQSALDSFMRVPGVLEWFAAEKILFWRAESTSPLLADMTAWTQVADVQPAHTITLDLTQTTDELLSQMKQKTRYNIRLAERKGVRIEWPTDYAPATERFLTLVNATSERHGIRHHPNAYYKKMVEQLAPQGMLTIGEAWHQDMLLSSCIFIHHGNTTTYLHGASSEEKKNLMGPYALQWAAIERAKAAGMATYDFFGVSPEGNTKHRLAGVTRFKEGFGGVRVQYPGTFEFPISRLWYMIYRTLKSVR